MGLFYDLISEFVKITNDKKEKLKEGTVYATIVGSGDTKYVKIDGSDLLTPMDTTTDIEDGERVTVMIKDHKATVTGNITSPSVSSGTVNTVVGNAVGENFTVVNSQIENLVAKDSYLENAYVQNSQVVNSKIENLEAADSRIENSVIENFNVIDGVVQDLRATNADIEVLHADFAEIKTLVNGNLTSDNILAFKITADKVTVEDAFIKDAMVDTISATKINSGRINTNMVSIGSEDGGMLITGSTQQFTDKNGNVRIQIGKDASGDFTFILYGEDGRGQIINQNGITATAIGDGLIVDGMINNNANISGDKLNISSVITNINNDNSTTIQSSKVYLDGQKQSLEVAFNSLKTQVDTIQDITISGDLTAVIEQVQTNTTKIEANASSISTLISEDTAIKKQVTDLENNVIESNNTLTSKYTTLNQSLEGFKTSVADTYATKSTVNDLSTNLSTNYSTTSTMNSAINQKANEITASVSSTYATKNEVKTLDDNLKGNYSTTEQMESAISVAKEEINLSVSNIYETKTSSTTKINDAVNKVQVGGTNLWVISDLITGYESSGNVAGTDTQYKTRNSLVELNGSKEIVYQCWNPNRVVNNDNTNRVAFFDSSRTYLSSTTITKLNGDTYQVQIISVPTNAVYVRLGAICGASSYDTSIKIKFELGNKPTDYGLAPQDIESEFSSIESETKTLNETVTSLQLGADSISASVKSLEETMTRTSDGLANDISIIQEQVNLAMTSEDVKIEIQNQLINGTNKVSTTTGYTFDENGLNVSKSDSEMKTQITEDGMKIYKNDDIMLTANNQGVDAKNLHATTYLIIGGNSRMENFIENGNKRTAVFWIG